MRTNSYIKRTGKKELTRTLTANKDQMYLNISIKKGDEVVYSGRANSLVGNFIKLFGVTLGPTPLHNEGMDYMEVFNNRLNPEHCPIVCRSGATMASEGTLNTAANYSNIIEWDAGSPKRARVRGATASTVPGQVWDFATHVKIWDNPNHGLYKVLNIEPGTNTHNRWVTLEGLDCDAADPTTGFAVPFMRFNLRHNQSHADSNNLRKNRIYVGSGDKAVAIDDVFLEKAYFTDTFSGGTMTVNAPVIAVNQSRIAMSAQFTNVSGSTQNVREVGLCLNASGGGTSDVITSDAGIREDGTFGRGHPSSACMVARDLVTPFNVDPAESFTVIYEFVTSVNVGETSGVVAAFNEALYRQVEQANRVVRTYFNVDHNTNQTAYQFLIRNDSRYHVNDNIDFQITGPILGAEETDVDIDDYFLRNISNGHSRIAHGEADGRLWYHATERLLPEETPNSVYLVFSRLVENRGSVPVTAKQIGFVCLSAATENRPMLITHDIIPEADQITIAPGELYRITYKIGVEINGGS